jgi:DeoR family suf operon transcriptional repressor
MTSRQRILDYIRRHRYITAGEISRVLRMTPANARHHLAILAEQGLVEVVSTRPTGGKGRPSQVFSPTGQDLGGSLEQLAHAMLDILEKSVTVEADNSSLRLLALRLAKGKAERDANDGAQEELDSEPDQYNAGSHLTQRLYASVSRLNDLGYAARWEARSDAPRVILGHCPYARILDDHPQLCRMDEFLLEDLLQAPVEQVAKLARDVLGAPFCMFVVHEVRKLE